MSIYLKKSVVHHPILSVLTHACEKRVSINQQNISPELPGVTRRQFRRFNYAGRWSVTKVMGEDTPRWERFRRELFNGNWSDTNGWRKRFSEWIDHQTPGAVIYADSWSKLNARHKTDLNEKTVKSIHLIPVIRLDKTTSFEKDPY